MPEVPYRVDKPWGYELVWARTDRYVGKLLHVRAGHVLSLQYHNRKDETMHVLRGELVLRTQPGERLEERAFFKHIVRPTYQVEETAVEQLRALGFSPADVRHIVVTHLGFGSPVPEYWRRQSVK